MPGIVTPLTGLTSLQRTEPYHGNSPYWRVALFADRKVFNVNGRFTYTSGERGFFVDESSVGPGRFGAAQNRQILTYGNGQPSGCDGQLNFTLLATSKLTLVNSSSVYNVRTSGNSYFTQFDNATQGIELLYFNYLGNPNGLKRERVELSVLAFVWSLRRLSVFQSQNQLRGAVHLLRDTDHDSRRADQSTPCRDDWACASAR